jgi:hypothetical protein
MYNLRLYSPGFLIVILLAAMLIFTGCSKDTSRAIDSKITDTTDKTATSDSTIEDDENILDTASNPLDSTVPDTSVSSETPASSTPTTSVSSTPNALNVPCTDSDGGLNYTVKGTVTVTNIDSSNNYTDYCRHGSFEEYIIEYSCGDSGVVTNSYRCPKKCNNNGACY